MFSNFRAFVCRRYICQIATQTDPAIATIDPIACTQAARSLLVKSGNRHTLRFLPEMLVGFKTVCSLPPSRLGEQMRNGPAPLVWPKECDDHLPRAAPLASQPILDLSQRECVAQVRPELY